jgi:hypothetical protein
MGHNVELFAGPELAITRLTARWPRTKIYRLTPKAQLLAVPLDPDSFENDPALPGAGVAERWGDPSKATAEEIAAVAPLSAGTALAYLATNYFGGNGYQGAILWLDGACAFGPFMHWSDRGVPLPLTDRPINRALRGLGLERADALDEFDAFGLGNYRRYEDFMERAFPVQ